MSLSENEQKNLEKAQSVIGRAKWYMDFLGIWPFERTSWKDIKFTILTIFFIIHMITKYIDLIEVFGNIGLTVENFSETGFQSVILIRMLSLRIDKKLQKLLTITFEDVDMKNYKNDDEKRVFIKYHLFLYKYLIIGQFITLSSITYWHFKQIPPYIASRFTNESVLLLPPYRIRVPFDTSPLNRIIFIYIIELPIIYLCNIYILTITLQGLIVLNVCTQLGLLGNRMKIYFSYKNENKTITEDNFFKNHVDKHCQLISIVRDMDRIYYTQLFFELLQFTILLALITYIFTVLLSMGDVIGMISLGIYCGCMLMWIFIPCYLGECLLTEVDNLRETYYQCLSHSMSIDDKKKLLICMAIVDKPLHITAGGFYIYTLNSFLMIIKSSMAYVSILRQME
ncbi:uncharacterized protein LOC122847592 [Aphidius gifuensis]|uniref:uncharacterized protein LOC122847592 n=1 Tax=Aphidius gifuensis TaxID=684658 RepID=UPI001CDCD3C6|nr:uncharacterized protein LOC122847592 [Aphidius gifuensis]